MIKEGGGMSHRRHRLLRGRVDRKDILQQVAREIDREHKKQRTIREAHKEPMFNSVREVFDTAKKKR